MHVNVLGNARRRRWSYDEKVRLVEEQKGPIFDSSPVSLPTIHEYHLIEIWANLPRLDVKAAAGPPVWRLFLPAKMGESRLT
jgi:hypothetical protein